MKSFVVAQLARAPAPGKVKTRLLTALSADRAAGLHAAMVRRIAGQLAAAGPLELWVAGDTSAPLFQECLQLGVRRLREQPPGDLGARMAHIAREGLASQDRVILVGSDAPGLSRAYVERALAALDVVDAVFGPALDGGYVLLGLRRFCAELFREIPWGTDEVLSASLAAADAAGCSHRLLEPLADIDRPEDLRHLPEDLQW